MKSFDTGEFSMKVGPYLIRGAEPRDAATALAFFHRVRSQSPYLLLEPGEGIQQVDAQRRQFLSMHLDQNQVIFFAFYLEKPVAFIGVSRGGFNKNCHVATMAIAVDVSHQRLGLGANLTRLGTNWARAKGVKRLELTVATQNLGAISLYRAQGFTEEGTKYMSFRIGERFVDELLMARILDP